MASWMIHLRIADALLDCWKDLEQTAFVMGNLAPDSGVPNEDWSVFTPPYDCTHFKTKTERGSAIDVERFCAEYLSDEALRRYNEKEFSFFLGYCVHLMTDIRWGKTIFAELKREHQKEYEENPNELVRIAKEDWYDLDFLYFEQHPHFRAFSVFEHAVGFENEFMEMFRKDAFDNRRQYICGFYRSDEHGALHRTYRYLTPERANAFVQDTAAQLAAQVGGLIDRYKSSVQ